MKVLGYKKIVFSSLLHEKGKINLCKFMQTLSSKHMQQGECAHLCINKYFLYRKTNRDWVQTSTLQRTKVRIRAERGIHVFDTPQIGLHDTSIRGNLCRRYFILFECDLHHTYFASLLFSFLVIWVQGYMIHLVEGTYGKRKKLVQKIFYFI